MKNCSEEEYPRLLEHGAALADLLAHLTETVVLVVGPEKVRMPCSKVLLGYFSGFFKGAFYGGFPQALQNEIELPKEEPAAMTILIKWLYTGQLFIGDKPCLGHSSALLSLEELWVMADRLLIPKLSNHAMWEICNWCQIQCLEAETAEYVYNNTAQGSKLRRFVADLIVVEGPFHQLVKAPTPEERQCREDWVSLLAKGGDVVGDCVLIGFANWNNEEASKPYNSPNKEKYLQEVSMTTPKEWLRQNYESGLVHGEDVMAPNIPKFEAA
ncbi:hypothetical protein BGZ60DRAFT_123844 [Tricladium varicosporioides]|nr:hypothetical protein BGZ60DRAFT_123844 [Hymenoscyphus varicosporioides]